MKQILKQYKISPSIVGIIATLLVMLPNIMYLFATPANDVLQSNSADYLMLNVLENIGRVGLIISLSAIVHINVSHKKGIVDIFAVLMLVAYYGLWFLYFKGFFNGLTLVGLALFPSVYFLLISYKLKNIFAFTFSLIFAVVHILITSSNFLF